MRLILPGVLFGLAGLRYALDCFSTADPPAKLATFIAGYLLALLAFIDFFCTTCTCATRGEESGVVDGAFSSISVVTTSTVFAAG